LLLPMILAGGGSFTTTAVTLHLRSNALVIEKFTGSRVITEPVPNGHRVSVHASRNWVPQKR
jgi:RNA 3'-terminal phosphate cyclase (ATP)